ncbi:MAG: hypothetical protein KGS61_03875 [Verrucomicrobia bacterium]|nr:hypothetical protein [Verrucomicrobiota bacterium]
MSGLVLAVGLLLTGSCRSTPPLPPVDLSAPGWQVRQGQAVWRPTKSRPEVAGDLWVATRPGGDLFVQFAKEPFVLATAQVAGERWRIEFGAGRYSRRGIGQPPARFAWFELGRVLAGEVPHNGWDFMRLTTNTWKLENRRTGESLEGYVWR